MSPPTEGFSATKPVSVWNQPLEAHFKDLFKALGKAAVHGAVGKWDSGARDLVDAATAVGLKQQPEQLAWLLVFRSLAAAVDDLVEERRDLLRPENRDLEALSDEIDRSLQDTEVTLDQRSCKYPRSLSLLSDFQEPLTTWLIGAGFSRADAESVAERLPRYFVFAFHHEWAANWELYSPILRALDTPASEAAVREARWHEYSAWLRRQVDEPLFGKEAFSLRQIYVPLRGYFVPRDRADRTAKGQHGASPHGSDEELVRFSIEGTVVELARELTSWVDAADTSDAVRVLSGGPGSGKSSLAKMFAAELAERDDLRVLFVPLHWLRERGSLQERIEEAVQWDLYLPEKPMDPKAAGERFLLILDGLDELAIQGQLAQDAATDLVREVERALVQWNQQALRLQVLLTGRVIVVQAIETYYHGERQILHLLPYRVAGSERRRFHDEDHLLETDQRQEWWGRYGDRTGQAYEGVPSELDHGELANLTAEPLLNYLLALSHSGGEVDFSGNVNLNRVYEDLVRSVFRRGWGEGQHPAVEGIDEQTFIRVMEEIALAVWHGAGRTATVREIEDTCRSAGLEEFLQALEEKADAGVTRLLTAFYFRRHGHRDGAGDRTFEFTHKSFGEYLAGRRIVAAMEQIDDEITRRKELGNRGFDERQALAEWARVCGPQPLDEDGFRFVVREVALRFEKSSENVSRWQRRCGALFGHMLRVGMPMEQLPLPTYAEAARQARNAEEALLAACSACARATGEITSLDLSPGTSFGDWLARTRGQFPIPRLVRKCLNRLDLRAQTLLFSDLLKTYLGGTDLGGAGLVGADLRGADLREADLREADLREADLREADLREASLVGADLQGANLVRANLGEANLVRAVLGGANLGVADLGGTNLRGADLGGADLGGANLGEANLGEANLGGANLGGANLVRANLVRANLGEADLRGANLREADLGGADLGGARFEIEQFLHVLNVEHCRFDDADIPEKIQRLRAELQKA